MNIDVKKRIEEAMSQGSVMSLGTYDDGGVWVADVVYVADESFNIYWMSSENVRHSKAIKASGRAAGSIRASAFGEPHLALQFEGRASALEGTHLDIVTKLLKKRGLPSPREAFSALKSGSLYVLRPSKIELIDELNFGFKKQPIELK